MVVVVVMVVVIRNVCMSVVCDRACRRAQLLNFWGKRRALLAVGLVGWFVRLFGWLFGWLVWLAG